MPALTFLVIGISKLLFAISFAGWLSSERYDVVYPLAAELSRGSLLSLYAIPFVVLLIILLLVLRKINWLEGLIGFLIHAAATCLSFYYVIVLLGA